MTPLAQALNTALLHFVWQGMAIGGLFWIALFLLRPRSANARYAASCAALVLLALAPVVTAWAAYAPQVEVPISWKVISDPMTPQGAGKAIALPSGVFDSFEAWILPAWALGVTLFALRLMWCWGHTSALRRTGTPADSSFLRMVSNVAERVGVARSIRVLMSSIAEVPSVVGWIRPVLLLPVAVAAGLTPEQLEAVIAHELAHIRRHDYLVNLAQTVVETVLFYHPAVWWVSSKMRYERELCCDDLAVTALGDARVYARALAKLEELRPLRPSLAMGAADGPLVHRIERLLGGDGRQNGPSRLLCSIVVLAGVVFLAFNIGWAQQRPTVQDNVGNLQDFVAIPPLPPVPPLPPAPPPPPPRISPVPPAPPPPPPPPPPAPPLPLQRGTDLLRDISDSEALWVLFQGDRMLSNAAPFIEAQAQAARQAAGGGDLLWFRRDGKSYMSQDKAILDRIADLGRRSEASGAAEQFLRGEAAKRLQELVVLQSQLHGPNPDALAELAKLQEQIQANAAVPDRVNDVTRQLEEMRKRIQDTQQDFARQQERLRQLQMELVRQTTLTQRQLEVTREGVEATKRSNSQILELLREAITSGKVRPAP